MEEEYDYLIKDDAVPVKAGIITIPAALRKRKLPQTFSVSSASRMSTTPVVVKIPAGETLGIGTSIQLPVIPTSLISIASTSSSAAISTTESISSASLLLPSRSRDHWSDDDIKCLLCVYKNNKHLFDSNSIKNDVIWKNIQIEMEAKGVIKTSTQIKNKMNNMKKMYKKVKDNNNRSGASPANFKYMDWFQELFGRDHGITPFSYAESSSSQPIIISPSLTSPPASSASPNASSDVDENYFVQRRSKRRTNSETFTTLLKEMNEDRKAYRSQREELRREERSQKMEILKEAVKTMKEGNVIFKEVMDKLIDKL